MTDLTRLTAARMAEGLAAGDFTSEALTQAHLDRIERLNPVLNAYLQVDTEGALATARAVDAARAAGESLPRLAGVPVAVKDIACTVGIPTTAGSRMLEGWVPPYDATIVTRLKEARMPILGKTNMDEFAMGSSTEHSAYGPTRNPWDLERIPGGSGGGSSAAVAAYLAPLAIGSDTGGSIRQPAAVTGTVGTKPTYGGVSRYGVIALASSLDQIGPCARTVADAALLHEVVAGHDPMDSTSIDAPVPPVLEASATRDLTGLRVGVVREISGEGFQAGVLARFEEAVEELKALGAEVVEVSCPHFRYAMAAYYLILPSEASSNLARYDAMRYGLRVGPDGVDSPSAEQVMGASRDAGFGDEVKRRIILGTYALSSGYYDAYYGQAQKVRTLIARDFEAAFSQADVLVSPTAPTTAFRIGDQTEDPMTMYLNDIATIPANLAGVPGLSLPVGVADEDGLPVGLQVLAPATEDQRLYAVAAALEERLHTAWGGPVLDRAPTVESQEVPA
ncbi:Asp-tRNA(Asn)/Glu-tRNA(Gln) amidotransferase subunit GatA [Ornithinimicrobium sediminis]|uniref:Asp-tRNA(Asn)/Glu-tRNA(Gln) amidotransferase subunit GatA n=1 Tax=Ornithinimicrobium sediminis TaxID=2904603 RepID=UPI001E58D8D2|nr:Asp-tRNA(Asn)/Glu-tRNA(Gln) amidotransferase subunit GatA [Ornithinimicrobium sediminis]MCE0485526.1 Asp-tRNA(Asn)/Glu-tRNA(Gln) amidotransferase subunit GatA [Ornithinimicrobium sediminis]